MGFNIKILFVFFWTLVLACTASAQIRVVDNKGTIKEIDTTKWLLKNNNIYNKNSQNVIIGESLTYVPTARFTVSTTSTHPAFKLKYPFVGSLADSILTWNSKDSIVRKISVSKLNSGDWQTLGNAGTNSSSFIGTIDNQPLQFKVNNVNAGILTANNTYYGYNAFNLETVGINNTAVGSQSLSGNRMGNDNVAIGYYSLMNAEASNNLGIGTSTGLAISTGFNNTFVGAFSDATEKDLINATAIGYKAKVGASNSMVLGGMGADAVNVGIGISKPIQKLDVNGNVQATSFMKVGGTTSQFLKADGSTDNSTYITNTPVSSSVAGIINNVSLQELGGADKTIHGIRIGIGSGNSVSNTALGANVLKFNSTGANNTAVGYNALNINQTGSNNSALGQGVLSNNSSGSNNTAVGQNALNANEIGGNNTAIGFGSLQKNISGSYNIAVGSNSLYSNNTASNNIAVGFGSMQFNTTGSFNVGIGSLALSANSIGSRNVVTGYYAGNLNNEGSDNVAYGYKAFSFNNEGSGNVIIGSLAAAINNTINQLDSCVLIGKGVMPNDNGEFNEIVIGTNVKGNGSNTVTIGDVNITQTMLSGIVYSAGTALTSDKRLKTNIQPVENGLSKIMQMNPVIYSKKASLESTDYNMSEIGFVAQELQALFPMGVVHEGKDKDKLLSVSYDSLIPILTKAIQEQQKIIETVKIKNDKQQKEIDELKKMMRQLLAKT